MNNDFDEFYDIVGTETIPEYTFVFITYPMGQYIKEIICPDGSRVRYENNLEWIRALGKRIKNGKAKYKKINRTVSSTEEAIRMR